MPLQGEKGMELYGGNIYFYVQTWHLQKIYEN